jgi:8-oxo-dGTP pyrophosphatase MutT (NUDIX family)
MLNHPMMLPWELFLRQLAAYERRYLEGLRGTWIHSPPIDWVSWRCGAHFLGYVPVERASLIFRSLSECTFKDAILNWEASSWTAVQRSDVLQEMLEHHWRQGLVTGWRNEKFSYWSDTLEDPNPAIPHVLSVERAGYRYLGMMSHAVHINGFLPDGRMWCGRRSKGKATDPGQLDNIAAGGLPTGETVLSCALRELKEEAGLFNIDKSDLADAGFVRTSRMESEGWHDESLHVYNLVLAQDFQPSNQDGEVEEFLCLQPSDVVELIRGANFTFDATASLLQGLGLHRS